MCCVGVLCSLAMIMWEMAAQRKPWHTCRDQAVLTGIVSGVACAPSCIKKRRVGDLHVGENLCETGDEFNRGKGLTKRLRGKHRW